MHSPPVLGGALDRPGRWSLRLLGAFELTAIPGGETLRSLGKRERALLGYLAVKPDGREQRKKLATLLWCESNEEAALDNLRTCLWRLRKGLGDGEHRLLASEGEEIVLHLAAFEVDAVAFRRLAGQAGRKELEAAAHLYAGDFLDGLIIDSEEYESWRRAESMRYRDEAVDALTRLMMHLGEAGETRSAIEVGSRILRLEPLHDAVVRRLMQLYGESGRRGAAVDVYRAHDDALRVELNAKPERETRHVFAELAQNGGGGRTGTSSEAAGPSQVELPPPNRTANESPSRGYHSSPLRKKAALTWGLAGCVVGVAAILLVQQLVGSPDAPIRHETTVESAQNVASPVEGIAIAVLPFVNESGDAAQDSLAEGTSEEITTALSKQPGLRVVGRSSVLRFKGEGRDLRVIGQALNARYLLDGSVRRDGDRVQITARLVHAGDGSTLWTESYDQTLTDILAIQADIARAIAAALQIPSAPQRRDRLARTVDITTYEYYLRARAFLRGQGAVSGLQQVLDVMKLLEQVVERNPDFAPAWATLAGVYDRIPVYSTAGLTGSADDLRRLSTQYAGKAEHAARRALELDPDLAEGYLSMAFIDVSRRNMAQAFDNISKALSLDPTSPEILAGYRNILLEVGRVEEALAVQQKVVALEPSVQRFRTNLATNLWLAGQDDAAIEILRDRFAGGGIRLAMIHAARGHYGEAADTIASIPQGVFPKTVLEAAARLLRGAPSAASSGDVPLMGALGFVYLHIGEPSRVVEHYESSIESGYLNIAPLWHEVYAPVRKTKRFKDLVQRARLPEFWRARGWPSYCRPIDADDFECG
jgi:TolB-like protein/DNA-binding SARP family transcriptional activator